MQEKYKGICEATGLKTQYERMRGTGNGSGKNTKNSFTSGGESGIISESGALNGFSKRADRHAKQYYESVRHMKTDAIRIAQNTGFTKKEIETVKNHVFIKEHDLDGEMKRFDESYYMALSWQRLIDGTAIEEQDIVLLNHELLESKLEESGLSHEEAHAKAESKYNYSQYIPKEDEMLDD